MDMNYTEINSKAISKWVENGWEWSVITSHDEYINAKNGQWKVVLTPKISVPHEWFSPYIKNGKLDNIKLLGLASGG